MERGGKDQGEGDLRGKNWKQEPYRKNGRKGAGPLPILRRGTGGSKMKLENLKKRTTAF